MVKSMVPDGATPGERELLRESVHEHARRRALHEEPEVAIAMWSALVTGRWSLVDRFERGGRRYIVARRNARTLRKPRALTARERAIVHLVGLGKPNKFVAYELGLAESTIATHLATAMRKLGAESRVELVRLAQLCGSV